MTNMSLNLKIVEANQNYKKLKQNIAKAFSVTIVKY